MASEIGMADQYGFLITKCGFLFDNLDSYCKFRYLKKNLFKGCEYSPA